ncbi:MAG: helix-turn-helix domain-containing protein [Lactobacillus sp.]|jgi:DNA-binding MarR family transcriptional regulator|nr:helix-turn-helix domain-containing protein [Lactobacillus sp.]MCI1481939.1 helix-turn-helix domain-containing protein [Lactobacillus sp.]
MDIDEAKRDLSKQEKEVYKCIATHRGGGNPISQSDIAEITGYNRRHVARLVRELRLKGKLIGFSRAEQNFGYFLIETSEEYYATIGALSCSLSSTSRVKRAMENSPEVQKLKGQLFFRFDF